MSGEALSDWALAGSMQAILDDASWEDLAATLCEEIALHPAVGAIWALRWDDATAGHVVSAAGGPDILQGIDEQHWLDAFDGDLLSLALSSPLRRLPVQQLLDGRQLDPELLRDLHEVALIPALQSDDRPWTLILLLKQPLGRATQLGQRLQSLWDAQSRQQQRALIAQACECAGNSMFITDTAGAILWTNPAFTALTGYPAHEAVGHNPRILNSGRHSARYYRDLWRTIQAGNVWSAEATDKDRFGYLYTIQQTISPVMRDGRITHYFSVHDDISQRKTLEISAEREQQTDAVTGLYNPTVFLDALADQLHQSETADGRFVVVSFSLCNYDSVVATLTEETRQQLLHEIGRRIRAALPRQACAGHCGHGDFGLMLPDTDPESVERFIADLQQRLNQSYAVLGTSPFFTLTHGAAQYPDDGEDPQTLWRKADGANGAAPAPQENTGQ